MLPAMGFGTRLKESRIKADRSQEDLASACGLTRQMVGNWEKNEKAGEGTSPTADQLAAVAPLLNVNLHWLITGEGREEPPPVTAEEFELLRKFRALDDRGRQAVMDIAESQYTHLERATRPFRNRLT